MDAASPIPPDLRSERPWKGAQGPANRFEVFERMLADLGTPIRPGMALLDFGCGQGRLAQAAVARGHDAYGCDFATEIRGPGAHDPRIRPIEEPYRLPFRDQSFDVVISDQVFEHVMDYPTAIAEIHRVMRPGAVFLHALPSRYMLVEGHLYIPLASFFRPKWWLWLWALLGVRNREFQSGLPAREVVKQNAYFLARRTHYLPPADVKREFRRCFSRVEFVERFFLPYSIRPRFLLHVPFGPQLYGLLWGRFLHGIRAA